MSTWRLRTEAGERGPLTIYQLQQLVVSGQAGPDAEVRSDGPWRRLGDVPQLARLLASSPRAAPVRRETILVNGVALELGPDGKPLPPSPEQIARMLAGAGERTPVERFTKARRVLVGIAVVLFAISAVLLAGLLLRGVSN